MSHKNDPKPADYLRVGPTPCTNPLEDDEHGQLCGDEGRLCDACMVERMQEYAWLKHVSKYAAGAPIDEDFEIEMRDAGRGHLVSR
jgi:hypothetical protein